MVYNEKNLLISLKKPPALKKLKIYNGHIKNYDWSNIIVFELLSEIGVSIASNVAQLIIGCLLSIPAYHLAAGKLKNIKSGFAGDISLIALFSLVGVVLPLGPYGVLPIFAALAATGLKPFMILPLLMANAVFNMLIPYNDVSFAWKTGMKRVVFALLAAILAGILLRRLKDRGESLLRSDNITTLGESEGDLSKVFGKLSTTVSTAGPYLIAGVIVDVVFHKYIWWDILNFITHNSYTSFVPGFFARYNVANPFFLLAMTIAFILLDFVRTSSFTVVFRLKGLVLYYIYFAAWVLLLGISAFI